MNKTSDPFLNRGANNPTSVFSLGLLGGEKTGKTTWLLDTAVDRDIFYLNADNGYGRLAKAEHPHNIYNIPTGEDTISFIYNLIADQTKPVRYINPKDGSLSFTPNPGLWKVDWDAFPKGAILALDSWSAVSNSIVAKFESNQDISILEGDRLGRRTDRNKVDGLAYYNFAQQIQKLFLSKWSNLPVNKIFVAHSQVVSRDVKYAGITRQETFNSIQTVSTNQGDAVGNQIRDWLNFSVDSEDNYIISSKKEHNSVGGAENLPPFKCHTAEYPFTKYSKYLNLGEYHSPESQQFITLCD